MINFTELKYLFSTRQAGNIDSSFNKTKGRGITFNENKLEVVHSTRQNEMETEALPLTKTSKK